MEPCGTHGRVRRTTAGHRLPEEQRPAGGWWMRVPDVESVLQRFREIGESRLGVGADEGEVAETERALGLTFPAGYRTFLLRMGWASAPGLHVFGLGSRVPADLDIRKVAAEIRGSLPGNALPFAGDEEAIFCLDTAHQGPYDSPVYRWHPEAASNDALENVGHDFASWLWMRLAERA